MWSGVPGSVQAAIEGSDMLIAFAATMLLLFGAPALLYLAGILVRKYTSARPARVQPEIGLLIKPRGRPVYGAAPRARGKPIYGERA